MSYKIDHKAAARARAAASAGRGANLLRDETQRFLVQDRITSIATFPAFCERVELLAAREPGCSTADVILAVAQATRHAWG
jgi:hypothetical protein